MFENLNWVPIWTSSGRNWKNEYWRCGELVKIELIHKIDKDKHYTAYIDYADFDLVKEYGLAPTHSKRKPDYMVYVNISPKAPNGSHALHRLLMDPPKDMVVDHINRNPLDNRRINLRVCTMEENNRNLSLRKNNSSGTMGVYFKPDKKHKPWVAQKYYKGAWLPIKLFKTKEEAIAHRKYLDETYK